MHLKPIYRMNDGVAIVGELNEKMFNPIDGGGRFYYEEISIGADDYTVAEGTQIKLSARIRIHRCEKITTDYFVKMKDIVYEIWRVRHGVNRRGVPITDITLAAAMEG